MNYNSFVGLSEMEKRTKLNAMIDYFVALMVLVAVIVFGALITVGNERQKRELAHIREVEEQWAEQDLRIKRGKLSRETSIEDPVAWLSAAMLCAPHCSPTLPINRRLFFSSWISLKRSSPFARRDQNAAVPRSNSS